MDHNNHKLLFGAGPAATHARSVSVSVAMATCNGMPWLPQQLDSILAQSQPVEEVVVSDDASSDGSYEYLQSRAAADSRIRLYRNERRIGAVRNFERAIEACQGDIIFLSDQDDVWHPLKVERQSSRMIEDGTWLAMSDGELVDADGASLDQTLWRANGLDEVVIRDMGRGLAAHYLLAPRYITGCATCFRADLRRWMLPVPSTVWHDAWAAFTAAVVGAGRITMVRDRLVRYRQHGNNQIGARVLLDRWWQRDHLRRYLIQLRKDLERTEDLHDQLRFSEAACALLATINLDCVAEDSLQRLIDERARFYAFRIAVAEANSSAPRVPLTIALRGYQIYAAGWRSALRDGASHLVRKITGSQRKA